MPIVVAPVVQSVAVGRRSKRNWKRRLTFTVFVLLAVFSVLELTLALFGVPPFRESHDPFLDFEPGIPLFVEKGRRYVTNPAKRTYFNEQSFPNVKTSNSFRIFCLGGSTTYGRPYQDPFSYVAGLRNLLQTLDPNRDWQVINCGGISYSSYRLAALMSELIRYEPDLVIFYEGHNEFLEERTYRDLRKRSRWISAGLKTASHLRTTNVIHRLLKPWLPPAVGTRMKGEVHVVLDNTVGPETYHRDLNLRRNVLDHFRLSVERICSQARRAGAAVILIQPACNLRDFSPFKSEPSHAHDRTLEWNRHLRAGRGALKTNDPHRALKELSRAVALDPLHADTQYLAGQAALAVGNLEAAHRHFVAAKDEDICPLRALSEIAAIVDDVGRMNGATVVHFAEYVSARCHRRLGHDIPDAESFVDHVHPHPDLHWELALLLVHEMIEMKLVPKIEPNLIESTYQAELKTMQKGLAPNVRAVALCSLAQELTWAGKIQEALPIAREAAELNPENAWILCQHGRLLERTGDHNGALAIYRRAVVLDPNEALAMERLGNVLLRQGQLKEAREWLGKAVAHPADHAAPLSFRVGVRISLGDCCLKLGDVDSARRLYHETYRIDSDSKIANDRLSRQPPLHSKPLR